MTLGRVPAATRTIGRYARAGWALRQHTHSRRDAAALLWFCVRLPVYRDVLGRPAPPVRFRLAGGPEMSIGDSSEIIAMREVFAEHHYAVGHPATPRTIVDGGANVGFASAYFATRFPMADVVAVEPDPRSFARLQEVARQLPNVRAVQLAMTGEDGPVRFHAAAQSMSSSLVDRGEPTDAIEVRGVKLATLLEEVGADRVDLLKLDIEGAEFAVLRSAAQDLDRVTTIVAEVHYDLGDGTEASLRESLAGFDVRLEPLDPPERFLLYARRR